MPVQFSVSEPVRRTVSEQSNVCAESPQSEAVGDYRGRLRFQGQARQDIRPGVLAAGAADLPEVVVQECAEPVGVAARGRLMQLDLKGL